jgi:hypothetical protein
MNAGTHALGFPDVHQAMDVLGLEANKSAYLLPNEAQRRADAVHLHKYVECSKLPKLPVVQLGPGGEIASQGSRVKDRE